MKDHHVKTGSRNATVMRRQKRGMRVRTGVKGGVATFGRNAIVRRWSLLRNA